jgi:hypothetical protein
MLSLWTLWATFAAFAALALAAALDGKHLCQLLWGEVVFEYT